MLFNDFGLSNNAISTSAAELSLSILRSLLNQFGAQFIKDMITLYITVSSRFVLIFSSFIIASSVIRIKVLFYLAIIFVCREQLSLNQLTVLEKILQMFQLVVQQPGNTWTTMLPSILNFTIEQVLPLLQQHDSSLVDGTDLSSMVYTLFDR